MKYYPIELHAHTCHSDGDFSIHQLIQAAKEEPYQVLTVTDHNTFAPYAQWRQEKLEQNQQDDFDGNLLVVPGIEWTTFYGHMLVIGANQVIDWRQAQKEALIHNCVKSRRLRELWGLRILFQLAALFAQDVTGIFTLKIMG
ncbi:CehA/McbA family metallohydrolase [Enterococcus gallinarum]|nr:CehA/McbA family metallohydrolase [Enterococcus gallinarum]